MSDHEQFLLLLRSSWGDRIALLLTFGLTVFYDLTVALQVGVVLTAFMFMHRMAEAVQVTAAPVNGKPIEGAGIDADDDQIAIYRIDGPFFFGTASRIADALEVAGTYPRAYILDFANVPIIDSTAANALRGFLEKAHAARVEVYAANIKPQAWHVLLRAHLGPPLIAHAGSIEEALSAARKASGERLIPS